MGGTALSFIMVRIACCKRRIALCVIIVQACYIFLSPAVFKNICYTEQKGVMNYDEVIKIRGDNRGFQRVTPDGSMYAYSAYYDPRDEPQLRVHVMCTKVFMNITYTCNVHLKSGEIHRVPGNFSIFLTYQPYKYNYVSGAIKCPLTACCENPDQLASVSITPIKKDLQKFWHKFTIPLFRFTPHEHKLAILFPGQTETNSMTRCLAPLHSNYNNSHKLIWSIEISRLTGADRFIFYNYSISPTVDKVLRHYMKEGIVEVRGWNIPKEHIYYHGQMIAQHDCLMSQMFSAKYVMVADLDEIFFPHNGISVVKMADKIFNYNRDVPKANFASLAFRCLTFIKNSFDRRNEYVYEIEEARRLQIEPLLSTTYYKPLSNSRKTLVIPERIDRMCVHSACFMRKKFKEKILKAKKEAVMLHYRDNPRHMAQNPSFFQFFDLLKYSREIIDVISTKMKTLTFNN